MDGCANIQIYFSTFMVAVGGPGQKVIENLRFLFSDDIWKWKLACKRLSCEGREAAAVNRWERGRNH